ncbi:MAG TPA: alpha-2-macroglobulin family protein [Kofleriaceae bacterium]
MLTFVSGSCGGKGGTTKPPAQPTPMSDQVLVQQKDIPPGLTLSLSDGKAGPAAIDRATLAPATKISDAEAQTLLARSPAIKDDAADKQDFALRPNSQPAPRTGNVVKAMFPAPPSTLLPPVANEAKGDLKVLRYMPEGEVPIAPELTVTFNQPMIAITSQTDAAATVPVTLTPTPKGKWRWIGTRTVLFDPEVRFPQATTYKVAIAKGTKSATGGVMKDGVAFTFETPAPTVVSSYPDPYTPQRLDVPMFVMFDQKIDQMAVLDNIEVKAGNDVVPVKLMSKDEIAKDKKLDAMVQGAIKGEQDGRWLAFRATKEFAKDTQISVTIKQGTHSAEGPNTTKNAQTLSFHTYPPLAIVRSECGWGGECSPGMTFVVQFNNPLDEDKWDDAQMTVAPGVQGLRLQQAGESIVFNGLTKARTTYKVTAHASITDSFGQTLGKDETRDWIVGDAQPTFFGPQGMTVLDPAAKNPTLDFFSTNYPQLSVKLYSVEPKDYDAFALYMRNMWNHDKPPHMPGKLIYDKKIKTNGGANELSETSIDLIPAIGEDRLGHAVAIVEPYPWKFDWEPPRMISWVQATKLAVDAYVDSGKLVAYASDLATGAPASDVKLELAPWGISGATDEKGTATLQLSDKSINKKNFLVAKKGNDVAFVTDDSGYWSEGGSWMKQARPSQIAWYVIDDRKMYKPGEDVTLKGWMRALDPGIGGDVGGLKGSVTGISYEVFDSRNNKIGSGKAPVSIVGGFDTKFTLPKTPNLGYASIRIKAEGRMSGDYYHQFQIEEFRRPEFEVSAKTSEGPMMIGSGGDVTVDAKYYAGGPLGGAEVNWYLNANPTNYTPPNRDDYTFGTWEPWWGYSDVFDDSSSRASRAVTSWSHTAKTDATGSHTLHVDFLSVKPSRPMAVVANASVTDVNRQTWSASAPMIVHPSELYVGVKTKRSFVEKGQRFDIDVIGVDLDGKIAKGTPIEVKSVRVEYEYKKGKYQRQELDAQTCSVTAGDAPSPCSFATPQGGTYQLTATIVDAKGRPNQTDITYWVSGGDQPPAREVQQERVNIIPDKKEYAQGDTAELLVMAPFFPAEAIVSWRRSGIVKTERITMKEATTTLKVPITDALVPNMFVQVDLVGAAARTDDNGDPAPNLPKRPAYAVGSINLPVPPKQRTLKVTVAPNAKKFAPGESAKLAVTVTDAMGKPVADSETAVIVVDEAILALTGYQFPDPIDVMYQQRGTDTRDAYLRSYVKLSKPDLNALAQQAQAAGSMRNRAFAAEGAPMEEADKSVADGPPPPPPPAPSSGMAKDDNAKTPEAPVMVAASTTTPVNNPVPNQPNTPIAVRSNFNPLAAFSPTVKTDANGKATVEVKLPDNLTRYRIVAVTMAGDKQFGKGESALTARLPLMVRPSPPRFLNFGDTFRLPITVQNQTDVPMKVKLAVRATNAAITDGAGREVSVPPNERVEVQFPAAAELAGTARFQISATSGSYADAAEVALPVWTPATTEAFATYGTIDKGATAQPVALPGQVVKQFGGIEVTTASTNLQALTDAFLYLVHYPFECSEQRSSRIMSIAALKDVLSAFKVKDMPTPAALEASVKADIEHLSQMQNWDGGFAFWDRGYPSVPYLSVYVVNALAHAKAKGFAVPQAMIDRAKPYLTNIEQYYPWFYPPEVRWAISAYALQTRKLIADLDIKKGQKLYKEFNGTKGTATMETYGWLLEMFAGNETVKTEREEIVRFATNHVSETAGAANFTTGYGDGAYLILSSDRRVDGVMLEALIMEQPKNDLIPKVVTGLLAHRKAGRWLNTQENTFALLALDQYFNTFEKITPDFVAKVWLGNDYAGDHSFKGRSTDYFSINIPMKDVATHDKQSLTIQKDGAGRLYYRIGMTYAPASLKLDAADYGFVVSRLYEGADKAEDVTRDAQGVWHIKAGARVRVKLSMVNENRRYHVALVDPMPAGLEAMNPALAVTGPIPLDPNEQKSRGAYWWWYGPWYEHQNMRDERTEAFASMLWEGVHEYSYVARATTPGNFVVPPAKAEEMYMPETFGRSASDRVVVE